MRKSCPNKSENEKTCPCEYIDCERHGICCLCLRYHREKKENPACLR